MLRLKLKKWNQEIFSTEKITSKCIFSQLVLHRKGKIYENFLIFDKKTSLQ